jgi:transposase
MGTELFKRMQLQILIKSGINSSEKLFKLTGVSRRTVFNIKKRIKERKSMERKRGSGRSQKMNCNDKQRISQITQKHPKWSRKLIAGHAAQEGSPLVSPWTVGRYLKYKGWLKLVPKKRPFLNTRQKHSRLEWCLEHRDSNWSNVIFTDESYFQFFTNTINVWSKGKPVKMAPKHGPKLMVWGGIGLRVATTLKIGTGSMDSERYIDTLYENLLPTMSALYPDGYILQQDNAPPHTAFDTAN